MTTIPPGGLGAALHAGASAISTGTERMQRAGDKVNSATCPSQAAGVVVEFSGDSLEDAMLDLTTSKYGIAAGSAVVKAADQALQTVFEVFG